MIAFRVIAALAVSAAVAGAQSNPPSVVRGRVVTPGRDSVVVVPHRWVTLHRVGTDHAGPLDSMQTSAAGTYAFTYRRTGAKDAIYFVSSSYDGIAYFTNPLGVPVTVGDDAEIVVFDTTSRDVPVSVRGHHIVVGMPLPGGERRVTEIFDLSNDASVTRVAANDTPNGAVWTATLPSGAHTPVVSDGDIPASAARFVDGRALVYAPFAPGLKQFAYSYTLAPDAFPLAVPVRHVTGVFEVLLEEPTASLRGSVRQVAAVTAQGRHFQRYLASDLRANTMITITVPSSGLPINNWYVAGLTLVIGGAMTIALARAVRRG